VGACTLQVLPSGQLVCNTHSTESWQVLTELGARTPCAEITQAWPWHNQQHAARLPMSLRRAATEIEQQVMKSLDTMTAADKGSHWCYHIRKLAASDRACPENTLQMLAQDPHAEVREALLFNPFCPDAVVLRLRQDKSPHVRDAARLFYHRFRSRQELKANFAQTVGGKRN